MTGPSRLLSVATYAQSNGSVQGQGVAAANSGTLAAQSVTLSPEQAEGIVARLKDLYKNEARNTEKLIIINQILTLTPNDLSLKVERVKLLSGLGKHHDVIYEASFLIDSGHRDPELFLRRGNSSALLNKSLQARRDFEEWIRRDGTNSLYLGRIARFHFLDKNYGMAQEVLDCWDRTVPPCRENLRPLRAMTLWFLGKTQDAKAEMEKYLEAHPEDGPMNLLRAVFLYQEGDVEASKGVYQRYSPCFLRPLSRYWAEWVGEMESHLHYLHQQDLVASAAVRFASLDNGIQEQVRAALAQTLAQTTEQGTQTDPSTYKRQRSTEAILRPARRQRVIEDTDTESVDS